MKKKGCKMEAKKIVGISPEREANEWPPRVRIRTRKPRHLLPH